MSIGKSPHKPKANRNPMPQRVIHPTNRTPASSSLANFKAQQSSRKKGPILAVLIVIQRATTNTTFRKVVPKPKCSNVPGSCNGNKQVTPDVIPKPRCSNVPESCGGNKQVTPDVVTKPRCSSVPGPCDGNKQVTPEVVPKPNEWPLVWSQNQSVPTSRHPAMETSG